MGSFKKAERKAVPLKIGIQGVSFSGKTMSSIKLAHGLAAGGKVYVIDTENDSAALYDHLDFYHATIRPPYTPEKYINLIKEAVKDGAAVIVIDTISHAWRYILEAYEAKEKTYGRLKTWGLVKPPWKALETAILQSPVHVIVTMREKAHYAVDQEVQDDGKTRSVIKKIGVGAITEKEAEYEFTVVWRLEKDTHIAYVEKDRTGLFDGRSFVIDESIGEELLEWLGQTHFDETPEWKIIAKSDDNAFKSLQDDLARHTKDLAKAFASRIGMTQEDIIKLKKEAESHSLDFIDILLEAEELGATSSQAVMEYALTRFAEMTERTEKPETIMSIAAQATEVPDFEVIDEKKFARWCKQNNLEPDVNSIPITHKLRLANLEQIDLQNRGLKIAVQEGASNE